MAIIISEYVEGSSLNKALELYNNGLVPVDLSSFTVEVYYNGNETAGATIELAGTLQGGATYVIADDGADAAILAVADLTTTANLWNGDDAIVLKDGPDVVDSFGTIGTDPGSEWGGTNGGAGNNTLVRSNLQDAGDTNTGDAFSTDTSFTGTGNNNFDDLGLPQPLLVPSMPELTVTEIWPGQSGDDVTADWFEIKNIGQTAYDLELHGRLFYDNESQDAVDADFVEGLTTLASGATAIIVIGDATEAATFSTVWGEAIDLTGVTVAYADGAGLGGGGDAVTLWLGDPLEGGSLAVSQAFPDANSNSGQSYQVGDVAFSTDTGAGDDIASTLVLGGDGTEPAVGNPGDGAVIEPNPEPDPEQNPSGLVISEIMFNPASDEDDWEWVEVANTSGTDIDMAGYVIDDGNNTLHTEANIAAGIVEAGGSAVLFNADDITAADFNAAWGAQVTLIPVTNWSAMGLNNGGDTVSIWDSFGNYIEDTQSAPAFAVVTTTYPNIDDGAGSIYLTDLSDQSSWALSTDGAETPVNKAVTAAAAGGNSGADIGSPSVPFEGPLPAKTLSTALLSTHTFAGASEINAFDPATDQLFVTSELGVTVVDLSDPATPVEGALIDPKANGATASSVTSVAVSPDGFIAMAVPDETPTNAGIVQIYKTDGTYQTAFTVGALPDMLTFNADGTKLVVANEGEADGAIDPQGTISIITIDPQDLAGSTIQTVDFTSFDGTEADLNAKGARIFPGKTASEDLEPEYITIQGNTAFVAMQEANAIATINLDTGAIESLEGLGFKDHAAAGNGLDASDRDGGTNIATAPLKGMYMPDAIASYTIGDAVYYITANEGDARAEDAPVKDLTLDPTAFPNAAELQADENLGRIQVSNINGDTDGDGDFDELFSYGARSFSIRSADGTLVYDSGDDMEQIMLFEGLSQDGRSDNKGPEPEGVVVGEIDGTPYVFVGLERTNAIVVYDVSDPEAPVYDQTLYTDGDVSPEGLSFIAAEDSPNGAPLLAVTNEVSATLSVYQLAEPAAPENATKFTESFEADPGTTYTLSDSFDDGGFDYFGRYPAPDTSNGGRDDFLAGFDGETAIHGQDHDGDGNTATQTITIPNVNITGFATPAMSVNLGALNSAPAFNNYEAGDGIKIYATVDAGARVLIGEFAAPQDGPGDLLLDTDGDGFGDGAGLTTILTPFVFDLPTTGNAVTLEIEMTSDASFEPLVVDLVCVDEKANLIVTDPDPQPDPETITKIHDIQGTGPENALDGQVVTVEAVVVGDFQDGDADTSRDLRGFYLQEEDADADGDAATSEGIFVFEGGDTTSDVSVGDLVRVTGTVDEFFGETQIDTVTSIEVIGTADLPSAATIDLPAASTTTNQGNDPQPDLEAYEGMLVEFADTMTITEMFQLDRFNEIKLVAGDRPQQFTQINDPSTEGYAAYLDEVGARRITYDDGLSQQNAPIGNLDGFGPTFNTATDIQMGDTIDGLSGVLTYQWAGNSASGATWRVRATQDGENSFDDGNPRETQPADVGGDFKVASLNVLNYFTTIDENGNTTDTGNGPRGADSAAEFERQADKIVGAIVEMDADVVALVELENSATDAPISDLVDRVNAALGTDTYDYVATGLVGDDAITNGYIYKTATTELTGDFAVLDETIDARFDTSVQRPALAQTFTEIASGESFTAAVNHFKSKGSIVNDEAAIGDGQGNNNPTRTVAAEALVDWLATDPTGSGDADFLILGDLNAYAKEDPVTAVLEGADDVLGTADDYTDLAQEFVGAGAYSYVFDGFTGTLDYALANEPLLAQVTGATEWHVNSDEPDAIDYNLDFGRDAAMFDGAAAARNSDHDPVIVGLDLGDDTPVVEPVVLGEVRGLVFEDKNGNGIFNGNTDVRLRDAVVQLIDAQGNVVAQDETSFTGSFQFADVALGDYQLRFDAPEGFGFVAPDQGFREGRDSDVTDASAGTTDVFQVVDEDILRFQSGLEEAAPQGTGDIRGFVFNDNDGSDTFTGGDGRVPGTQVRLLDADLTVVDTATTGFTGNFGFDEVAAGTYYLEFDPMDGTQFVTPDQGAIEGRDSDVTDAVNGRTDAFVLGADELLRLQAGVDEFDIV